MKEYKVAEKFVSINGEGRKAGQLSVFIRFCGCNLSCSYCDTSWANENSVPFEKMTEYDILEYIKTTGIKNVTLTGGEPLLQKEIEELLVLLSKEKELQVEIETNGSLPLRAFGSIENRPSFTMDYKLMESGMEEKMCLENFEILQKEDTVKFVIGSRADCIRAKQVIEKFQLTEKCSVYFSPVFGKIKPAEIVDFMIENRMNGVNMQLQLHKFIWDPNRRGV